ncbi:hypothetical protein [Streptomyces sp. Y1]|uniref:Uncharacterized protein n=1 Tax=Streptomyces sp. Y1 TaxID=3238634 RepID=A0AB39TMT5_9ACTN
MSRARPAGVGPPFTRSTTAGGRLPPGPAYGALIAALGIRLAADRLLERLPEILAKAIER